MDSIVPRLVDLSFLSPAVVAVVVVAFLWFTLLLLLLLVMCVPIIPFGRECVDVYDVYLSANDFRTCFFFFFYSICVAVSRSFTCEFSMRGSHCFIYTYSIYSILRLEQ